MNKKYYLKPGYIFFSSEGHILETVLGSCVSVCLFDNKKKIGIMTHYIYAFHRENEMKGFTGSVALPFALKLIMDKGAQKKDIEAHVIGGGKNPKLSDKIGKENSEYALEFLKKNNIKIRTIDVGMEKSRKVIFNTDSGEIKITLTQ